MVSFPSRNLGVVMVNSPPILNSPAIASNGTRIASTWSNSKGMDLSDRPDADSGARPAANEVTMLDLTSSPPKKLPTKRIPQALSRHTKGSTSAKGAATTAQIVKVLDYQKRHKLTLTVIVKYFNDSPNHRDIPILSQPKLTQWRKKEDESRALLRVESGQGSTRRNNSVMHPNLEKALAIWCTQSLEQNTTITTDVLRLNLKPRDSPSAIVS
ncbi:BQ5605_C040g11903 [Microbotryum silenes-dioicae]|uniref:BQ5605_C040g11903 protein n=1 Tax=Microbotryum silenes-dioicae TaxID=796604 RepID=A0A2X0PPF3_9BASI|nr:BQ5605_C040g11903 [Microbotryum silenes-dioicae]